MSDLSLHPVYLSARAAIVAPERAIPVTLYATQKWLPRLGPERWCLIMLLRGLCIDSPRRNNGIKRLTCSWRDLADMLDVHEETVASWLKHEPIPNDKPWRRIIAADEKAAYLSFFIPRLRYAYETHNGKTRRLGFLLEILMEDPVVPEDEVRLQQQVELLRMQQGELGLETYRLNQDVAGVKTDLLQISPNLPQPDSTDLRYVNPQGVELHRSANRTLPGLHKFFMNSVNSDLLVSVKQQNLELQSYVNPLLADLDNDKSEKSVNYVNELDILIQQLKQRKITKNLRKDAFEPIVSLTEKLLQDNHSRAMLYKVLTVLYPERVDLYVAAVNVALSEAEIEPNVNRGAVFVRALREFADDAGVDLGLKSGREGASIVEESVGTRVPTDFPSLPSLTVPSVNEAIWAETLAVLRPQMTRATFDTIIQGTSLIGREDGDYIVGVQSEMAKEWLENRLRDIVRRALSSVIGVPVNVEFRLIEVGSRK
jgi:hypothetical protein